MTLTEIALSISYFVIIWLIWKWACERELNQQMRGGIERLEREIKEMRE